MKPAVRRCLTGLGYYEVVTYSLVSQTLLDAALVKKGALKLMNPLTKEQEFLRPTLAPSLINSAIYNLHHNNSDLQLFEVSHVFDAEKGEAACLGMIATGKKIDNWQGKKESDFFSVKGDVLTLLEKLGIIGISFVPHRGDLFKEGQAAEIIAGGKKAIGVIGCVNSQVLSALDLKHNPNVIYAEIFLGECAQFVDFSK